MYGSLTVTGSFEDALQPWSALEVSVRVLTILEDERGVAPIQPALGFCDMLTLGNQIEHGMAHEVLSRCL